MKHRNRRPRESPISWIENLPRHLAEVRTGCLHVGRLAKGAAVLPTGAACAEPRVGRLAHRRWLERSVRRGGHAGAGLRAPSGARGHPGRPARGGDAQRSPSGCATSPFGSRDGHHAEACAGTVVRTSVSGAEVRMREPLLAPIRTWLAEPMHHNVSEAIERLRRAPDVEQIAVMPDVHLAADVCIGVVVATSRLIYPQAVGGDIGCGILAVGFDAEATALQDPRIAGRVLAGLGRAVPARRRNRRAAIVPPTDLELETLSHPSLEAMRRNEGLIEFATLGSGNHFIELQSDDEDRLWLMVHSGSRGVGPAIRDHHMEHADDVGDGLHALDAAGDEGIRYLTDATWARRFADANRRAMAAEVGTVMEGDRCAPLLGDARHDRSQPRIARTPRSARSLGPPKGRNAGRTWARRECCQGRWAAPASTCRDAVTPRRCVRVRTARVGR